MSSELTALVHKLHDDIHTILTILDPKSLQPDDHAMPTFRVGDKTWSPSHTDVARWQAAYPDIDVLVHIARASTWYAEDGRSFRSIKGARKAVGSWLKSDNDKVAGTVPTKPSTVYREVDLDD